MLAAYLKGVIGAITLPDPPLESTETSGTFAKFLTDSVYSFTAAILCLTLAAVFSLAFAAAGFRALLLSLILGLRWLASTIWSAPTNAKLKLSIYLRGQRHD